MLSSITSFNQPTIYNEALLFDIFNCALEYFYKVVRCAFIIILSANKDSTQNSTTQVPLNFLRSSQTIHLTSDKLISLPLLITDYKLIEN